MTGRNAAEHRLPSPDPQDVIPVSRPRLPNADTLYGFLKRIDETRWYSNFGPLVTEFEDRLARRFTAPAHVVSCVNATQALTLTLKAMRLPEGSLCAMPAFTFVASAHAVLAAGLTPFFVDVDAETWMVAPETVRAAIARAPGPVSSAMVVSAFGALPDLAAWRALRDDAGVQVVVDAAGAFDRACEADLPTVVSLHATKALGIGEGGFLTTAEAALADDVRRLTTFGFRGSRVAEVAATNAKLSEYSAAVGLAALDAWPQDRLRFLRAAQLMRAGFANAPDVQFQKGWGASWVASVCNVRLPDGVAEPLSALLRDVGVETRRWWGAGCADNPAFSHCPRADLAVTSRLAGSVLGLPFSIDLDEAQVNRIVRAVRGAMDAARAPASPAPLQA